MRGYETDWSAIERGNEDAVETLINEDADIEEKHLGWILLMKTQTNRKIRTALSFAAAPSMNRRTACRTLKLLLESGAEDTEDDQGLTAKDRARKEQRLDAVAIFEDFGNQ